MPIYNRVVVPVLSIIATKRFKSSYIKSLNTAPTLHVIILGVTDYTDACSHDAF